MYPLASAKGTDSETLPDGFACALPQGLSAQDKMAACVLETRYDDTQTSDWS